VREKIVLIGAGSAVFTRGLVTDLIHRKWELDLALVDIDPDALGVAEGLTRKMIAATGAPIRLSATTDRREALKESTAVICTVAVGGRRGWEQDVQIPRKYGVYQPVGDTVMPGGASRALRMIPAMVAIATDVLDCCPSALFFNYSNPMNAICRAVRKATGANVVGLCHGVKSTARYLAQALEVPSDEFRYTAIGVNHLTWFVDARSGGADLFGRLLRIAAERNAEILKGARDDDGALRVDNPFTWQMTHLFGAFPAVLDNHVVEFFPRLCCGEGAYYGKTLGVGDKPFENLIARGNERYAQMKECAESSDPLPADYFTSVPGEHEEVVDIIDSVRTGRYAVYSANLPNRGQVPNLPEDAVLETPAVAMGGRLKPVTQPPLPANLAGTLVPHLAWVETVVEAAIEGNRDKFVQAMLLEGSVTSIETARRLADELIAAHRKHLPQFEAAK